MPLIATLAALVAPALSAGTAVWLEGTPDPSLTPGLTPVPVAEALPSRRWDADDDAAREALVRAVEESRPRLDVFDGELQILRDLGAALEAVEVVRPEDRELLWQALVLQGLAAHRYFGEVLDTDPAAAPYAARVGGLPAVGPWRDAVALAPDRLPTETELPDEGARLAFQETRARLLLEEPALIHRGSVQPGVRFLVDGQEVGLEQARLSPGTHRAVLQVEGTIRARVVVELEPGERVDLALPASPAELAALAGPLGESRGGLPLEAEVLTALAMVEQPVELVLPVRRGVRRFEVRDGAAVERSAAAQATEAEPSGAGGGSGLRLGVAAAWLYDGDWLLQNAGAGAPSEAATVNAVAPLVSAVGELGLGPALLGLGLDAALPLGTWHELPSGEGTQRLRLHGHLQAGLPLVRATVGFWSPWHLAVGARAAVPLGDDLAVDAAYVHGLGLTLAREAGQPDFEPAAARMGWLGLSWRFGA